MASNQALFRTNLPDHRATFADGIILLSLGVLFYGGLTLAKGITRQPALGEQISLTPQALPLYTLYSVARMLAAYILALLFTLLYGRMAAYNRRAEKILLPLLDVLQSVPILSFLPVVLLSLMAVMPQFVAAELASALRDLSTQARAEPKPAPQGWKIRVPSSSLTCTI